MKWFAALLPYLAVAIGLFGVRSAVVTLLAFHAAILVALWLAKPQIPVRILFRGKSFAWSLLSILLCGSSGVSLYFLWPYFGVIPDLPADLEALGLTVSTWIPFIAYFVLINPLIEEYFWRGYLGSATRGLFASDFLYAGFHTLLLINRVRTTAVLYSLIVLVLAGWFWRQLARADEGLLAPVLGHMAADFTILMALYQKAVGGY
jgi:membrane protease YdiL (CAAX protease family)